MVDMEPALLHGVPLGSSQLGVLVTVAPTGRWTGIIITIAITILFLSRYDSKGKYMGSLPDLPTTRSHHGCTSFVANGVQVKISTNSLNFKKVLLVAGGQGGFNGGYLASTEMFLPSKNAWTTGGNLPG